MREVLDKMPRLAWLIIGLYLLLAGGYAVATPLFEKPDEQWHFAFAMYFAETGQLPTQTLGERDHLAEQEGSQPPLYYAALAAVLRLTGYDTLQPGFRTLTEENPYYGGRAGAWRDNANQFVHVPCQDADCERTTRAVYVGRGISILFGVIALLGAAATIRLALPENNALLLLTLAIIAFTPQFLHITSSVSNDAVTIAMVNLAFALGVAWLRKPRLWVAGLAGVVVGLATLGKMSGLSAGVILGSALLIFGRVGWRERLLHLIGYGAAFLAVTGWWFWRNIVLYGEPTATAIHLQVYGTPPDPLTVNTLTAEWQAVINSFWASFGWGGINPDDGVYTFVRWLLALFLVLFIVVVIRRWHGWTPLQRTVTLLMVGQLLLVGLLHFRWMRLTIAPLGRLMFPAILPIAFMIAIAVIRSSRWGSKFGVLLGGAWLVVAVAMPFLLIQPAYTANTLPLFPTTATPIGGTFGDSIVLEGYKIEQENQLFDIPAYTPGEVVPITLYWRVTEPITEQLSISLKFFGWRGELLSEYNSYPDGGRAPITGWQPGDLIVDRSTLVISPTITTPTLAMLEIDLFERDTLTALPVAVNGTEIRPFRPIYVKVNNPFIVERSVEEGYSAYPFDVLQQDNNSDSVKVKFSWDVGVISFDKNYQAFLHLTSDLNQPPIETGDFTPGGGNYPTSYWQAGELVRDEAEMELPTDLPPGQYILTTGLYDLETQARIPGYKGETVWTLVTLEWDGTTWREIEE